MYLSVGGLCDRNHKGKREAFTAPKTSGRAIQTLPWHTVEMEPEFGRVKWHPLNLGGMGLQGEA